MQEYMIYKQLEQERLVYILRNIYAFKYLNSVRCEMHTERGWVHLLEYRNISRSSSPCHANHFSISSCYTTQRICLTFERNKHYS